MIATLNDTIPPRDSSSVLNSISPIHEKWWLCSFLAYSILWAIKSQQVYLVSSLGKYHPLKVNDVSVSHLVPKWFFSYWNAVMLPCHDHPARSELRRIVQRTSRYWSWGRLHWNNGALGYTWGIYSIVYNELPTALWILFMFEIKWVSQFIWIFTSLMKLLTVVVRSRVVFNRCCLVSYDYVLW